MNDTNSHQTLVKKVQISTSINYTLYALLIGVIIFWNLNRDEGFKLAVLLLQSLPLLAFLPGMIQKVYRSYSWLCFILLFYFIFAIQSVFSTIRDPSDFVFLALIVLLFISSMMASRWVQRLQKGVS